MKLNDFIAFFIVLLVAVKISNYFSYNIQIENENPKWMIFFNHPYLSIKNKFALQPLESKKETTQ